MMRPRLFLGALAVAAAGAAAGLRPVPPSGGPPAPSVPAADRVLVAEAFRLAGRIGDSIWPGWAHVPFALVLVTPDTEFFIRHPSPPKDARSIGTDPALASEVFARPRTFPTGFLATFPIEGVSTVVVGEPQATGASSPTDWVVTILHEHFHQLQEASPGFYERVNALGLSRGDTTGMWMLDFPFPYDAPPVAEAYRAAALALRGAARGGSWDEYLRARAAFRATLSADDRKYLDFELWKEGVARYTQVRVARWAAEHDAPAGAFAALPGFVSYAALSGRLEGAIGDELSRLALPEAKRIVVYPYGAAEALLLDRERPCWRDVYFSRPFTLAPAFDAKDCGGRPGARG